MALGFDNCYARALGRKRVVISNNLEASTQMNSPLKRVCSGRFTSISESSRLEDLPLDILIKVLCGVNHEDLKQLFLVSRTIREAAEIAKQMHFDFSTPKKETFCTLHNHIDVDGAKGFEEIEAPHAPLKKSRSRSMNGTILDSVSANLFHSMDEEMDSVKQLHFDFITPKKKTFSTLYKHIHVDGAKGFEEIEAPDAPLKKSRSRPMNGTILDSISANLFPSIDEEMDFVK